MAQEHLRSDALPDATVIRWESNTGPLIWKARALPIAPRPLPPTYLLIWRTNLRATTGYLTTSVICRFKHSSFQGDSGGPLVCQTYNGSSKQVGVISFIHGESPASYPVVLTEVSQYKNWINSYINWYSWQTPAWWAISSKVDQTFLISQVRGGSTRFHIFIPVLPHFSNATIRLQTQFIDTIRLNTAFREKISP